MHFIEKCENLFYLVTDPQRVRDRKDSLIAMIFACAYHLCDFICAYVS